NPRRFRRCREQMRC
ncbi:putative type II secretory pathway, component PulD, partial [Vibrio parahaemolyticus IDH02640]